MEVQPHERKLTVPGFDAPLPELPVALDLAELPVVLPMRRLPKERDGSLAEPGFRIETERRFARGVVCTITVQGDRRLGLPYAQDGEILMAVLDLYLDEIRRGRRAVLSDGRLSHVSMREIGRRMGHVGSAFNDEVAERIRLALMRFSGVVVTFQTVAPHAPEPDGAVLMPGRQRRGRRTESVEPFFVLRASIVSEMEGAESEDQAERTRHSIQWIQVDPIWLRQAAAGLAAWIDLPVYLGCQELYSRALYPVLAAEAAHGRPGPWEFALEELCERTGIPLSRPNEVRTRLVEALQELQARGVLQGFQVEGARRNVNFTLQPGPLLDSAQLLRGVTLLDERDTSALLAAANQVGLTAGDARQWAEERPHDLRWVLAYTAYKRSRGEAEYPAAYARTLIERGFNPRSDPSFLEWYERASLAEARQGSAVERVPPPASEARVASANPIPLEAPALKVTPRDPAAVVLWEALVERMAEQPRHPFHGAVRLLAPYDIRDTTLVCVYEQDIAPFLLQRSQTSLEAVLQEVSAGAVRALGFEPVSQTSVAEPAE